MFIFYFLFSSGSYYLWKVAVQHLRLHSSYPLGIRFSPFLRRLLLALDFDFVLDLDLDFLSEPEPLLCVRGGVNTILKSELGLGFGASRRCWSEPEMLRSNFPKVVGELPSVMNSVVPVGSRSIVEGVWSEPYFRR